MASFNGLQLEAVKKFRRQIVESMSPSLLSYTISFRADGLLSTSEHEIVQNEITSDAKTLRFLDIVNGKDGFYDALLRDLWRFGQQRLTEGIRAGYQSLLEAKGEETLQQTTPVQLFQALAKGRENLARAYLRDCSAIRKSPLSEEKIPLADVFVPLVWDVQHEERSMRDEKGIVNDYTFAMRKLLRDEKDGLENKVMVISANPGQGKTTLVKKICYDWSVISLTGVRAASGVPEADNVLRRAMFLFAVPCRNLQQSSSDIIDIFFSDGAVWTNGIAFEDIMRIRRFIKTNLNQVLILLDGYDELARPELCSQLQSILNAGAMANPPHPVIVTSRPNAIHGVVTQLRLKIRGLSADEVSEFVAKSCREAESRQVVLEFIAANPDLLQENLLQIPLLLNFLCCLADAGYALPTSVTELYLKISHALYSVYLKRCNLVEPSDHPVSYNETTWRQSKTILAVSKFAFDFTVSGNEKTVFEDSDFADRPASFLDIIVDAGYLVVDDDSFFRLRRRRKQYNFFHKTIQEFFAALHASENVADFVEFLKANLSWCPTIQFFIFYCGSIESFPLHQSAVRDLFERKAHVETNFKVERLRDVAFIQQKFDSWLQTSGKGSLLFVKGLLNLLVECKQRSPVAEAFLTAVAQTMIFSKKDIASPLFASSPESFGKMLQYMPPEHQERSFVVQTTEFGNVPVAILITGKSGVGFCAREMHDVLQGVPLLKMDDKKFISEVNTLNTFRYCGSIPILRSLLESLIRGATAELVRIELTQSAPSSQECQSAKPIDGSRRSLLTVTSHLELEFDGSFEQSACEEIVGLISFSKLQSLIISVRNDKDGRASTTTNVGVPKVVHERVQIDGLLLLNLTSHHLANLRPLVQRVRVENELGVMSCTFRCGEFLDIVELGCAMQNTMCMNIRTKETLQLMAAVRAKALWFHTTPLLCNPEGLGFLSSMLINKKSIPQAFYAAECQTGPESKPTLRNLISNLISLQQIVIVQNNKTVYWLKKCGAELETLRDDFPL